MEARVDDIEGWGGMFPFANDGSAVHVVEKGVEFVGLIGEASVVEEDIFLFPCISLHFWRDADRGR